MHNFIKMGHFDLVDRLAGASILSAIASERPCSLIAEALGVMHGDLDLSDFCERSD